VSFIDRSIEDSIATIHLNRGKVNPVNEAMVDELKACFEELESDPIVKAVVLTGQGKFFSFGFDIPGFLDHSKDEFAQFLTKFADLYAHIFLYPKPVIAALNGHAIAGGGMIATACDYRLMVEGKAKISLNEITFGSSVFAGSVEMLKCCVGQKNAESVLYSGAMFSADEALSLGLIHQKTTEDDLSEDTKKIAHDFAQRDSRAFESIKMLLRKPIAEQMTKTEKDSIREFVDIWYSENTWKLLREIRIRS